MEEKTCKICGAQFLPKRQSRGLCCSKKCVIENVHRATGHLPKPLLSKPCAACGTIFQPRTRRTISCGIICHGKLSAAKHHDRAVDKFWTQFEIGNEGCWEWKGKRNRRGYGQSTFADKNMRIAHRTMWQFIFGPIPNGLFICHHCDNPPCIRPSHLFLGTHTDNMLDSIIKERFSKQRLSIGQIEEIHKLHASGKYFHREIALKFGVSQSHVTRIVNNHPRTIRNHQRRRNAWLSQTKI